MLAGPQLSATCEAEATVLVGPRYGKLAGYACACRSNLAKWRQRRLRWRKSRQTPTNSFTAFWAAHRWLWRYFLLGAVIVVPIWLLVRLAKAQHSR